MRPGRPAGVRGVVPLVGLVLVLAGCGAFGRAGPVAPGLEVGSAELSEFQILYPGPGAGDDQRDIVGGFLRAGAASDGAYENARRFLASDLAQRWNPDSSIALLATDASPTTVLVNPRTVRVTAPVTGVVDASGRYTAAAPGALVSATFALALVDGQYRIRSLPGGFGRWVTRGDVPRLVRPFAVHYVSTSRRSVVPDVRWFPLDRLATRLARAQLDAVPAYLRGAATTAVPRDARLLGDAVSVEDGVATVDLVSRPLGADEDTRREVWAQFLSTLLQDPTVERVALAVDGVPVDVSGVDGSAAGLPEIGFVSSDEPTLGRTVVRVDDKIEEFSPVRLGDNDREDPSRTSYPVIPAAYTRLAVAAEDRPELAAVDPDRDGISRWRGGVRYGVPGEFSEVGSPSYDRRGFLWFGAVGEEADRVVVVDISGDPADARRSVATPVRADWLTGRRVLETRVAADGDRVAVLSTAADGRRDSRIDVTGVIRGGGGRPERLADPMLLGRTVRDVTGLAWLDDRRVVTLGLLSGLARQPILVSVDGAITPLAPVPGAVGVAAAGGDRNVFVLTQTGAFQRRDGLQWAPSGAGSDLAVPAG
jgi:hypothetical protein